MCCALSSSGRGSCAARGGGGLGGRTSGRRPRAALPLPYLDVLLRPVFFLNPVDIFPPRPPPPPRCGRWPTIMARLGLIIRLMVGALVNTMIVLALLASAAVVLLWIVGRNKQLRAQRQQRYVGECAAVVEQRCPSSLLAMGVWQPWMRFPRG